MISTRWLYHTCNEFYFLQHSFILFLVVLIVARDANETVTLPLFDGTIGFFEFLRKRLACAGIGADIPDLQLSFGPSRREGRRVVG